VAGPKGYRVDTTLTFWDQFGSGERAVFEVGQRSVSVLTGIRLAIAFSKRRV
jgi:hypothetical protein